MTEKKYIVALDQGTTSSRALLFDKTLKPLGIKQQEFSQIYPSAGWVEHNPMEIFSSQNAALWELLSKYDVKPTEIAAIGITNQRETTIVWNRHTGKPVCNAVVWQCRRTSDYCEKLKKEEIADYIRENTGLIVDAYFSATKIKWILDNIPGAREAAKNGDLLFGTVDTWLLWKFTEGKVHATDVTNASRTMLYNIKTLTWDKKLLEFFDIPESMLPEVKASGDYYGEINLSGCCVPVTGIAGDQQASLFGQGCFYKGNLKNTYGTGCFLLANIGNEFRLSEDGLITTVAANLKGKTDYALEGSVFTGGAVIQWLRDELKIIDTAAESEEMALSVDSTHGVYIVPAFTGLGAPHWDMYARGTITGITRGTNRKHIIRAALESIAFQSKEVIDAMTRTLGTSPSSLKVDGGACANNFLMQFQADIIQKEVLRPAVKETTALGAAALAGLTAGFYKSQEQVLELQIIEKKFCPEMPESNVKELCIAWQKAIEKTIEK